MLARQRAKLFCLLFIQWLNQVKKYFIEQCRSVFASSVKEGSKVFMRLKPIDTNIVNKIITQALLQDNQFFIIITGYR